MKKLKDLFFLSVIAKRYPLLINNVSDIEEEKNKVYNIFGKEKSEIYYDKIKKEAQSQLYYSNTEYILKKMRFDNYKFLSGEKIL